eukprot:10293899-Lingulodinium_polyedra.AAC.1
MTYVLFVQSTTVGVACVWIVQSYHLGIEVPYGLFSQNLVWEVTYVLFVQLTHLGFEVAHGVIVQPYSIGGDLCLAGTMNITFLRPHAWSWRPFALVLVCAIYIMEFE